MRRSSLIHVGVALALLLAALGVYGYWYLMVGNESAHAQELAAQVVAKSTAESRVTAAKVAFATLEADEKTVEQYFLLPSDIVAFLGILQSQGHDLGASIEVASVSAEPGTPHGRILLSLKISGTFNAVLRTIGSIEYGPYDSEIHTLTFDTVPSTPGVPTDGTSEWTATTIFSIGTRGDVATSTP